MPTNFTQWKPQEMPQSEKPLPIQSNNPKFDTCANRSKEIKTKQVPKCCGQFKDASGYDCSVVNQFPLDPRTCISCLKYINKE